MLLLSLNMGTTIAEKPAKPPGKPENPGPPHPSPPPPPPKYEFYITIGLSEDDVFLENPPLTVVSYVNTCGWYWPPESGTNSGGWSADLNRFFDPVPNCGIYNVNLEAPPDLPDRIYADSFSIYHSWSSKRDPREYNRKPWDFWEFYFMWGWDLNNPEDYSNVRILRIWTDWGIEPEGNYDSIAEIWTIDFNGASWELGAAHDDGTGYKLDDGTISHGFTVTIVKGELVS
jgi:hypothetical protein